LGALSRFSLAFFSSMASKESKRAESLLQRRRSVSTLNTTGRKSDIPPRLVRTPGWYGRVWCAYRGPAEDRGEYRRDIKPGFPSRLLPLAGGEEIRGRMSLAVPSPFSRASNFRRAHARARAPKLLFRCERRRRRAAVLFAGAGNFIKGLDSIASSSRRWTARAEPQTFIPPGMSR